MYRFSLFLCLLRTISSPAETLSVMTFNVENLFDAEDDPQKSDETFLPIAKKNGKEHLLRCGAIKQKFYQKDCTDLDWTDKVIDVKMEHLAKTILQVNNGKGPDLVTLAEVENIEILERFRRKYLEKSGFKHSILIEGNDKRGIDVAMLSKLDLVGKPKLHDIIFRRHRKKGTERGILEASFKLPDGKVLTAFAVHLLAPSNPTIRRTFALEELNEIAKTVPAENLIIAAGDFNITFPENRRRKILETYIKPDWIVAHESLTAKSRCLKCIGTHYTASKHEWSFFDMILLYRKSFGDKKATWQLRADSVRIPTDYKEQLHADGSPNSFDPKTSTGVSDHLPLFLQLETK